MKPDGTQAISTKEMLGALGKDRYGIAFSDPASKTPNVKALALARNADGPYVPMNLESVRDRSYPLHGESYFYIDRKPGTAVEPLLKEFLRYVLSRQGQREVMRDGKWLPLTPDVVSLQRKKLQ
jgi:phosphate transport system substrate-binding protein